MHERRDGRFALQLVVAAVAVAVGLAFVIPANGQESTDGSGKMPPDIREHYIGIMRAQAVLLQIPPMIMGDETIKAQHTAFADALVEAMVAQDGETTRRLERVGELQRQTEAAPGGQDALLEEGRRLRDALLATADQVLDRPAVAAAAEPLVASLTAEIEQLEGVGPDTLRIVTDEELLLNSVTAMTVFSR
jgi:hypothetical protein